MGICLRKTLSIWETIMLVSKVTNIVSFCCNFSCRLPLQGCKILDFFCKEFKDHLTHYQTTNFRLFQTERVCRLQFEIDENGRKLSKQVENTVGKGEIAHHEQYLLVPQCFQKTCFPGASKGVIVCEWVKDYYVYLFFTPKPFNRIIIDPVSYSLDPKEVLS